MMRIEERFDVAAPPELTFQELNDVSGIGRCIAGVQEVTIVNDDESRWKLQVLAGFMALTITLDARITARRPYEYIAFAAGGQDVELTGHVSILGSGATSTCEIVIDADIGGPLGPLADVMARGQQQALVADTVKNIRARLTALSGDEAADAVASNGGARSEGATTSAASAASGQTDPSERPRPTVSLARPAWVPEPLSVALGGILVLLGYLIGRGSGR
jgi:carbon monoxide dehydrogenase subunit G